ncbi:cytochrome P450 93A3-like [Pistacia vera]|uniref:cytochrome P450 93A3-like n=1 Tax=Pistacia vera TaxID=55513 RepID=UPI001262C191|nr:cytochrome P450 93A3-like [Pistacia vera]XP_031259475.1 cytochrome P450 93A3-like [Pistacia vera]
MADFQVCSVFFIWVVSMILMRAIFRKTKTKSLLPPSPLALPIIGHLHLLGPLPHQALHKLSTSYGPLIHIRLGSVRCVVASSPEIAREIIKNYDTCLCGRPKSIAINYLSYGLDGFLFADYGPYWRFLKKLCVSDLLGGRTLNRFLPVRSEEVRRFINFMLRKANESEAVNVGGALTRLTNNVISRMTMSQKCSNNEEEDDEVRKLVKAVFELIGKMNLADFIWFCKKLDLQGFEKKAKEVRDKFDSMMERIIKEHEEARRIKRETGGDDEDDAVKDFLDILLEVAEDESSEIKLSRENIKSFILEIFSAGTDTSASTMEWALAELINHPDAMKKAREEIDLVVGRSRLVEESDIANLPYLQAIVKETMRLHPNGPLIMRESIENCTIQGYEIPAKTRLFINVWAIGRDPNHWENPLEFRPERFLGEDEKKQLDVRGQHFQLLPFGGGRRACPGMSLALCMIHKAVAAMIQCFEWKLSDSGEDGTVDMEEGPGLTLPRAHPLICYPVTRLTPFPSF